MRVRIQVNPDDSQIHVDTSSLERLERFIQIAATRFLPVGDEHDQFATVVHREIQRRQLERVRNRCRAFGFGAHHRHLKRGTIKALHWQHEFAVLTGFCGTGSRVRAVNAQADIQVRIVWQTVDETREHVLGGTDARATGGQFAVHAARGIQDQLDVCDRTLRRRSRCGR